MDPNCWSMMPSGTHFTYDPPNPKNVHLSDIVHNLCNIRRFNGSLSFDWTVAEHTVLVSRLVPNACKQEAMGHDMHEAYTGDWPRPIIAAIPEFTVLQAKVDAAVRMRLGNKWGVPSAAAVALVKAADDAACWAEANEGGLRPQEWGWRPGGDLAYQAGEHLRSLHETTRRLVPQDMRAWFADLCGFWGIEERDMP